MIQTTGSNQVVSGEQTLEYFSEMCAQERIFIPVSKDSPSNKF